MSKENKHRCKWFEKLSGGNDSSLSIEINKDNEDHEWMLVWNSYYDQEDVELGEAQEKGESAGGFSIAINYYPFVEKN